jgi:hypothetical protein
MVLSSGGRKGAHDLASICPPHCLVRPCRSFAVRAMRRCLMPAVRVLCKDRVNFAVFLGDLVAPEASVPREETARERDATNHLTPSPALTDRWRVRPINDSPVATSSIYLVNFLQDARVPASCDLVQRGRLSANMIAGTLSGQQAKGIPRPMILAKMTEGKPEHRISPAEGPGL